MKQTAVSWYSQQEIELTLEFLAKKISELDYGLRRLNLLNQAKEMEHEQHQETFKQSRLAKVFEKDMPPVWESWEQYYNETFKNKYGTKLTKD
jgi:hypothetical protein